MLRHLFSKLPYVLCIFIVCKGWFMFPTMVYADTEVSFELGELQQPECVTLLEQNSDVLYVEQFDYCVPDAFDTTVTLLSEDGMREASEWLTAVFEAGADFVTIDGAADSILFRDVPGVKQAQEQNDLGQARIAVNRQGLSQKHPEYRHLILEGYTFRTKIGERVIVLRAWKVHWAPRMTSERVKELFDAWLAQQPPPPPITFHVYPELQLCLQLGGNHVATSGSGDGAPNIGIRAQNFAGGAFAAAYGGRNGWDDGSHSNLRVDLGTAVYRSYRVETSVADNGDSTLYYLPKSELSLLGSYQLAELLDAGDYFYRQVQALTIGLEYALYLSSRLRLYAGADLGIGELRFTDVHSQTEAVFGLKGGITYGFGR